MKTSMLFLALFMSLHFFGQNDLIFTHIATSGTISSGYITNIDHPDLNNNPDASIFVTHNYNPGGNGAGILNNNSTGTWYNNSLGRWTVFNEDFAPIVIGAAYNVYVANQAATTIVSSDGSSYSFEISSPFVNNDPNALLISSKYWNPSGVYNTQNYGFWYAANEGRWNLYAEDGMLQPTNAAYKILLKPGINAGTTAFKHTTTALNTLSNYTYIDHPLLNGNPNAVLITQHNWGTTGDPANIIHDKVLGVWYTNGQWAIYNEDQTAMVANLDFNIYVNDTSLSTLDTTIDSFHLYPMPAIDIITIDTSAPLDQVEVFNLLGQKLSTVSFDVSEKKLDISLLSSGTYFVKITSGALNQIKKIIKH